MSEVHQLPTGMPYLPSIAKTTILAGMEEKHFFTELSAQYHICTEFPCRRIDFAAPIPYCCRIPKDFSCHGKPPAFSSIFSILLTLVAFLP